MPEPTRILIIEDRPADALLAQHTIRQALEACQFQRVDTIHGVLAALEQSAPDLIISDFNLPQFDGLAVLALVLERAPLTPVIIFTGAINEDTAVACMKAGATDYVIKEHMWRLGPAVLQALDQTKLRRERQQAEEALRESEERYRTLAEAAEDAIFIVNADGTFQYVNQAAARFVGASPTELVGRPRDDVFPRLLYNHQEQNIRSVFATGQTRYDEYPIATPTGELWFHTALAPIVDAQWHVHGVLGIARDITERKRAEHELLNLREAVSASHEAMFLTDADGTITWINPAFCQLYGYSANEVVGKVTPRILKSGLVPPEVYTVFWQTILRKRIVQDEIVNRTKDQRLVTVDRSVSPVLDSDGAIIGFLTIQRDVTARKQAERLQSAQFATSRILAASPDMDVALARVLEALAASFDWPAAELWELSAYDQRLRWRYGWYAPSLAGRESAGEQATPPSYDYTPPAHPFDALWASEYARAAWAKQARLPGTRAADLADLGWQPVAAIPIANHTEVWGMMVFLSQPARPIDAALVAMFTDLGRQIGQFVARKQAELALVHERALLARRVQERTADLSLANLELTKALRTKDEFLATMSHELRTPLNGILALSEALAEQIRGPLNQYQLRSVQNIETSGRHLLALINDILDLSKVEAGKLELQLEPLGVVDICHASLALVREVAIQKHIQLSFRCDDLGLYLLADAKRLKQILVNLLSNAVKFTPEGGRVWLEVIADEPQNQVHISVRDTGVGIAPENMGRLFRPFTQLDSGLTRQHEGTGLGLALVKRLTELHGGSVAASSTGLPGQGSCFTVALPWRQLGHALAEGQDRAAIAGELSEGSSALAQASGLHERQSQPERRPLILLAEDNEINILVIEDYVDSLGYRLVVARNGQEAIERALEQHPDLILMDIHMPVLDGLEATRRLRAMPEFATTPIIALTALAMPSDRDLCMQAGATEYVSKPLSLKALAVLMRQLLGTEKP